jgi:ATP-dependent DNA helicase UvrD/PcrA
MKFIADFHIHSHYSMATSKQLEPQYLDYWARLKGISVIGTGDFSHPSWVKELREKLEPAESGLFKLKEQYRNDRNLDTSFLPPSEVRFMLTAEISNIYKSGDKVRKVHNVIFAPDFETVDRFQQKLIAIGGNITSDGRPILGLDSRDLLEMALESSPDIFFVPAHIWTPWFSALGSKSGFDTIKECYKDLAHHIFAVETGLSTDPPMNWMCSFLDDYTLISNSDAHSPQRLGRNANRFNTQLSYPAIIDALKSRDPNLFQGTIDLFPQEGKYHYDGHRKCGICWDPVETLTNKDLCSVCGKSVTVGVMNRVVQLSDREDLTQRPNRMPFKSIIPLKEMISELEGVGPNSKKVHQRYMSILKRGVSELEFLLNLSLDDIQRFSDEGLAEAVRRMRNREIHIQEGFDGEYGIIKVFAPGETPTVKSQSVLFEDLHSSSSHVPQPRKMINFDLDEFRRLHEQGIQEQPKPKKVSWAVGLNPLQLAAVQHFKGPALVIAGPGTGKTRVLTQRVIGLIREHGIDPQNILAVTFTNKAAQEIRQRLQELLKNKTGESIPTVATFHGLGYSILQNKTIDKSFSGSQGGRPSRTGFRPRAAGKKALLAAGGNSMLLDPEDRKYVLQQVAEVEKSRVAAVLDFISNFKQQMKEPEDIIDPEMMSVYQNYQDFLVKHQFYDLDDLVTLPVRLFRDNLELASSYRDQYRFVLIDEYQDINYAQYMLIRTLFPDSNSNVCAIGDPDQAIYGFRGADVGYINQFSQDYPGAVLYRLQQSYRCSDSILKASGDVIHMGNRSAETLLAGIGDSVKIKIVKNSTHRSEAEYVARTIEQMIGGLRFFSMDSSITQGNKEQEIDSLSDFVVLCRVKSQMEAIEKSFDDHSIPYQTIGEEPFYKQEPLRNILDVLRLALHPSNIILREKLIRENIIDEAVLAAPEFQNLIKPVQSVSSLISAIIQRYFPSLSDDDRLLVKQLHDFAKEFDTDLEVFLQSLSLGMPVDSYLPQLERVTIMTLHAAKGLEFQAVFIVGCEEGLLPYKLFKGHETDIDEERRLLYVGMTRAKKFLFLSHADKRFLRGREYNLPRSTFLEPIEQKLIQFSSQEIKKKEEGPVQRSLF